MKLFELLSKTLTNEDLLEFVECMATQVSDVIMDGYEGDINDIDREYLADAVYDTILEATAAELFGNSGDPATDKTAKKAVEAILDASHKAESARLEKMLADVKDADDQDE